MALTEKLSAIGNAIREKTGTTELLSLDEMPVAISGIETGGGSNLEDFISGNTTEVNLPDATKIINKAFYEQKYNFTKITMPNVTKIGDYAFYYAEVLQISDLPPNLTEIGQYAFMCCRKTTIIAFPSTLTKIGQRAFAYNPNLAISSFPASLQSIEYEAFSQCPKITTITFEGTPTKLNAPFLNATNLKTINVPWIEGQVAGAPWGATNATINYNYNNATADNFTYFSYKDVETGLDTTAKIYFNDGWTWSNFVESDFNTVGIWIDEANDTVYWYSFVSVYDSNGNAVDGSHLIDANISYQTDEVSI